MKRGQRIRLEEGIYQTRYSIVARVKLNKHPSEKPFAFDTPLEIIRDWRIQERARLSALAINVGVLAPSRTLGRDVRIHLAGREGRSGMAADRSHLRAVVTYFGADRNRRTIARQEYEQAFASWAADGVKPKTLQHRRRVICELYVSTDGRDALCPVRGLKLPRVDNPAPIPTPNETIERVAKVLKASGDPKTYARYLVQVTTGQRAAQIGKAEPGDVQLRRTPPVWYVRPAKGGNPVQRTLTSDAEKAWRVFIRAKAWGKIDTSQHAKRLRKAGWPHGVGPSNARHTLAIDLLEKGADLSDVQSALGHTSIQTTRQFYAPYTSPQRMQAVLALRKLDI